MNHYPHHIGDFNNATRHLTRIERSLYRDLIDLYYDTEQPLSSDTSKIARRILANTEDERAALRLVLEEFFVLQDDGWHNARCDGEIARYRAQVEHASLAGKASAASRLNKRKAAAEQLQNGRSTTVDDPPVQADPEDDTPATSKLPPCPTEKVIELYHQKLPELPSVRITSDRRRKAIASMWRWVLTSKRSDGVLRAQTPEEALAWLGAYFERVRENDFLMGRSGRSGQHAGWVCDIDYLLTERGRIQVIEKT